MFKKDFSTRVSTHELSRRHIAAGAEVQRQADIKDFALPAVSVTQFILLNAAELEQVHGAIPRNNEPRGRRME